MAELSVVNVLAIAGIACGVWYFFDAMRARELATAVVREYCKQSSLQFLDGTVGLRAVNLSVQNGRIRFKRRYEFHYSESNHSRGVGLVTIEGIEVQNFILPNRIMHPSEQSRNAEQCH